MERTTKATRMAMPAPPTRPEHAQASTDQPNPVRVLEGVRVLDLGSFITAPYAAMLLAEMGADVIKVERPGQGDPFRSFKGGLYSSAFQAHNRNKRSVTLDYANAETRDALDALLRSADVLLLNVRPGVERRLGVDHERVRAINPRLVHCSITGYGPDGPYAKRPAYDNVGQALSGWLSMFHQGSDPRIAGPATSDALTGLFAALGICGALTERQRTGVGRRVEVSMLEATLAFATEPLARLSTSGAPPAFYSRAAASQSFVVTCADGLRIGLHLSSPEKFWTGLVQAISRPDLAARYPDRLSRVDGYEALAADLAQAFASKPRQHWLAQLEAHDVPFAPERRLEDLADDEQVRHLGTFYRAEHPTEGASVGIHRPVRFDGSNFSDFLPPPALGEHTDAVLGELGLPGERIEALRTRGLI